jgi:hypothetical protein
MVSPRWDMGIRLVGSVRGVDWTFGDVLLVEDTRMAVETRKKSISRDQFALPSSARL